MHPRPTLRPLLCTLVALLFLIPMACEPTSDVDHYAIAQQMEQDLGEPKDYSRPEYEQIAMELSLVQTGDATYDQAQDWRKQIQKARKDALFQKGQAPEIQEGGAYPSKPSAQARSGEGDPSQGSWTAAGWVPYGNPSKALRPSSGTKTTYASASAGQKSSSKCASGPVILYGTSWCGVCKQARSFFSKNGVSYIDKDIEADATAAAELKRKAPMASGVPVIDVGGEIVPGFSESALKRKLCL